MILLRYHILQILNQDKSEKKYFNIINFQLREIYLFLFLFFGSNDD